MQVGTIVKRQSSLAFKPGADERVCYQGELLVACDAGEVMATGGPCPIIVLYDAASRHAAVMHISGEDAEAGGGGDGFVEMVELLDEVAAEFPRTAVGFICLDQNPYPGLMPEDEAEQAAHRMGYAASARDYLTEAGFAQVQLLSEGQEKTIRLNTSTGKLVVLDEDDGVLLTVDY
jgi:hypothetical protein